MQLLNYLKTNPKSRIIFDFDETIVHLHLPWSIYSERLFEAIGKFDKELVLEFRKTTHLCNAAVKKHGDAIRLKILELAQWFEKNHLEGYTIHDDIVSVLPEIALKAKLHILSTNSFETVDTILKELSLQHLFSRIIGRDQVTFIKPDPQPFDLLVEPSVSKAEYLMVGDSNNDSEFAKAVGIDFFDVNPGRGRKLNQYS